MNETFIQDLGLYSKPKEFDVLDEQKGSFVPEISEKSLEEKKKEAVEYLQILSEGSKKNLTMPIVFIESLKERYTNEYIRLHIQDRFLERYLTLDQANDLCDLLGVEHVNVAVSSDANDITAPASQENLSDDYLNQSTFAEPDQKPESVDAQVPAELEGQEEIKNKGFRDICYEYAKEQAKWKKEQGELKVKFNRIMEDLFRKADSIGEKIVEKVSGKEIDPEKSSQTWNPPQREIQEDLKRAKKDYIDAKKEKLKEKLQSVPDDERMEAILEFEQKEFDVMQKLIQEELADTEQSLHKKVFYGGLKKWRKLSPAGRIAVSSTLMGVGGAVAFGSAGIIPIAGAVAYRAARGVTGALASYGTARSVDAIYGKYMKERDAQRKNEVLKNNKQEYTVDLDKYEEIEKKSREYFENEQKRLKYKNIAKASAAVLVGGGVNYGMNLGVGSYNHVDGTVSKPSVSDTGVRVRPVTGGNPTPQGSSIETPTPKNIEIQTELNSKGFIKTFDDLKEKILKDYGNDKTKLPPNLKTFVDTSSTKLAIDNGLYDPSHNASAMGLKGEHLSVDKDGHLTLKHLGDKPAEVIDTGNHKFNVLHKDKMFTPKESPVDSVVAPEPPKVASAPVEAGVAGSLTEPVTDTPSSYPEQGISNNENDQIVRENSSKYQTLTNEAPTGVDHVAPIEATSEIKVNAGGFKEWIPKRTDTPFATEHVFEGKKIFQLADFLQEDSLSKSFREDFVKIFERTVDIKTLGKVVKPIPFEGGIAHVVQGANDKVHVLLNGKPIAEGLVDAQGAHVKLLPGMQHGGALRLFFADNAFERVFKSKAMTNAIKTLTIAQK